MKHARSCAAAECLRHAMIGNGVVVVDRAVADDGWAGVFGIATLPYARGKGAARSVLAALADWFGAHEADRDYPEWDSSDLKHAQAFYELVGGKAKVFLDLLIDHPGRLLTVEELCELSGGVFTGSRSVAGAINGLYRAQQSAGRRYPFYWWAGNPARYAIKPSVALLFGQARNS